jgi:hypothetical protein
MLTSTQVRKLRDRIIRLEEQIADFVEASLMRREYYGEFQGGREEDTAVADGPAAVGGVGHSGMDAGSQVQATDGDGDVALAPREGQAEAPALLARTESTGDVEVVEQVSRLITPVATPAD